MIICWVSWKALKIRTVNKLLIIFIIVFILSSIYIFPRILEIYKPLNTNKIIWNQIFDLKTLDKDYVAQGIEVYQDYLFYSVHKKDEESHLIVFQITSNKNLKYLFTTKFPKIATHISDLSVHNNSLYAIDYDSNNLYKINITSTLDAKTLIIDKVIPTNISRSGSIIVTDYNGKEIILISQFIIDKNIKAYNLNNLDDRNKKPIFEIKSKYFIQGLYKNNNNIYITSNTSDIDPIFVTSSSILFETKTLDNYSTLIYNGPGKMIEDIVIYNDYIITSDEETNKIYITKKQVTDTLNEK